MTRYDPEVPTERAFITSDRSGLTPTYHVSAPYVAAHGVWALPVLPSQGTVRTLCGEVLHIIGWANFGERAWVTEEGVICRACDDLVLKEDATPGSRWAELVAKAREP